MGRREEKREATRLEILNAASELFRTKGYDSTSVDDIVAAANLAKGTFYYHFQKKDDLVMALQESQLKEAAALAREALARGDSPRAVLFKYLSEAARWTEDNSEIARAIFRHKFEKMKNGCPMGEEGPPPAIKRDFFELIIEIIECAQRVGEVRSDMAAPEIAQVIIPVVMSARMTWLMGAPGSAAAGGAGGNETETLGHLMERVMRVLLDGLVPRV